MSTIAYPHIKKRERKKFSFYLGRGAPIREDVGGQQHSWIKRV